MDSDDPEYPEYSIVAAAFPLLESVTIVLGDLEFDGPIGYDSGYDSGKSLHEGPIAWTPTVEACWGLRHDFHEVSNDHKSKGFKPFSFDLNFKGITRGGTKIKYVGVDHDGRGISTGWTRYLRVHILRRWLFCP
jgi:hypothetical protein